MNRFLRTTGELAIVLCLILVFTKIQAFAGSLVPISDETRATFESANLPVPPADKTGQEAMRDLILAGLGYVKPIIAVLGVLYMTIAGYRLVTAGDEEEEVTKVRKTVTYIIIAFILISMSQDIAKIFDMQSGTLFQSPQEILNRVHLYDRQVEIFVTFTKFVLGAYAAIMIVRSGIKLIFKGDEEETMTENRRSIAYSLLALVLVNVGDIAVNKVFYNVDKEVYSGITGVHPSIDAKAGVEQIIGIVNLIVSFIGPAAILMLIIAAIMYATSGGDEEKMNKAKRVLVTTVVAIAIIFGAFALINTVVSGSLNDIGALAQ